MATRKPANQSSRKEGRGGTLEAMGVIREDFLQQVPLGCWHWLVPVGSLIALWKLGAEARARNSVKEKNYVRKKEKSFS